MIYSIRKMTFDDLGRVFAIEKAAHIAPWTKTILRDCIDVGYGCFVIEKAKRIKGFMIARAAAGECHLLNICVAPRAQGEGLGEAMLQYLIKLTKPNCTRIQLEVRPSNEAAIKLYEKYHFEQIGTRKNYYLDDDGSKEDAIVLELSFEE